MCSGIDVKVSPDGSMIFVTGTKTVTPMSDYTTVAYHSTGIQAWVQRLTRQAGQGAASLDRSR